MFTDSYIQPIMNTLSSISERQRINSSNVANAQTPGYKAKSASFADLLGSENPFETSLSTKMGRMPEADPSNTGKPVELQKELVEMQKNLLFYNMTIRRISTVFTELKSAAQVGR